MTPTLLAATMLLLGQAPASPFPSTPPPAYAPAPSAAMPPAETQSDQTTALQAALNAATSAASAAEEDAAITAPAATEYPYPAGLDSPNSASQSEGPALVPIGESPAPAASTASLPDLGQPPAAGPAPTQVAPAAAPPAAFPVPPAGEMRSVLVEPAADAVVQPASSEQPLTSPASSRLSQTVLERLLTPPDSQALAGQPTQLAEALPLGGERLKQVEAVQAYWEATLRTAVYHATLADLERLASVPAPTTARERTVFEQALLAAEANARQAELKAVDAQYTLAEKAGLSIVDLLPLPADEPLTGSYRTHYDTLFSGRTAPVNLRRIDRTLPMCQRLLESRAASLVAAENVWDTELAAYQRGDISLEVLLVSFDRLGAQRIAFLELVRRYNFDIAEYALSVSTTSSTREATVGMLIETDGMAAIAIQPTAASAPLPAGASGEGVIIYGEPGQGRVIRSGPTPAIPGAYSVPGQPSPAVRPVPAGTPMLSPTPATPTPAATTSPAITVPALSPSSGAGASLPSPAEVAGPGAFRDVTPGRAAAPASGGEVRLAQATEAIGSLPSGVQPAALAPRTGRINDTPAPPGLEGTHSVLVRP